MKRPALNTLACVNPACRLFHRTGEDNFIVRNVYRHDYLRLLCCRTCGEKFPEPRENALCNAKITEEKTVEVINPLDEDCGVRATAHLTQVVTVTVARLLRMAGAGRHAEHCHIQHVQGLTPRVLEFDGQWSFVKKAEALPRPRHGCVRRRRAGHP